MTTYANESVVCGACGHVFTRNVLASTNAFGSPDLDLRPPEMQRSTMHAWVQRCPSCGYCAPNVAVFDEGLRHVLDSAAYRAQLADPRYRELTSTFIASALLAEAGERTVDAAWAYLHAAWTLDDAKNDALACIWRSKAADAFLALLRAGTAFTQEAGAGEAIVSDCLRRAGRGAEALPLIERALGQYSGDVIQNILKFQKRLIEQGDTSRHLVQEALAPPTTESKRAGRRG